VTLINSPVQRETAIIYRRRPLVIVAHPRYLEIREKKRRDSVMIPYDQVYEMALRKRFNTQQAEKKAAKKARRAAIHAA
jgi:hypothetical protein